MSGAYTEAVEAELAALVLEVKWEEGFVIGVAHVAVERGDFRIAVTTGRHRAQARFTRTRPPLFSYLAALAELPQPDRFLAEDELVARELDLRRRALLALAAFLADPDWPQKLDKLKRLEDDAP